MDLLSQLLCYIDRRDYLSEIRNTCEVFLEELNKKPEEKFSPFRFLMEIDVMDLLDIFPKVGETLLREPIKFKRMCDDIIFASAKAIQEDRNETFSPAQFAVNIRLKCVPRLFVQHNYKNHEGLEQMNGTLIAISAPISYVYHTVWSCPEECEGNEVILPYIPKGPPKCYVCKSVLFENSGLRRCGEQVTATFKLRDDVLCKQFAVVDDLIAKLKLGATYDIIVVSMKKTTSLWSLEEVLTLAAPLTAPVAEDIKDLFKACKGISWQFIYCLASSIGFNICPLNCFMHIKICLLLSLASVKANRLTGATIIHVLVAGYDTSYVGRLMEEGAKLADTAVYLGTTNTSAPTALIGSSGGVCVMPLPIHVYNKKQTSSILASIETGEITTETGRTKLQCAVWAQGMDFKKVILFNVASVFGTVCRGDYGEYCDEIVEFALHNAVEPTKPTKEEVQAMKDLIDYTDLVSGIDVTLENQAERLLGNYFLAARKERPRGVTVGNMGSLVATCLTSARLCRRRTANIDDATFAIWLHICGSPEPRFAPDEYLQTPANLKRFHKMMDKFKEWLQEFTGRILSY